MRRLITIYYVRRCLSDNAYAKKWATVADTPITTMKLSEEECAGEEIITDVHGDELIREPMILGENIPHEELVLNSSWSVLVRPTQDYEILRRLDESLPKQLFPDENDNFDSMQ